MNLRLELFVSNVEEVKQFYISIFDFEIVKETNDYLSLEKDSVTLGIGNINKLESTHPLKGDTRGKGIEIVLEVEDIYKTYNDIRSKEYPINTPLQNRDWGLTDFRLKDPEGYYIRVTSKE
ncbi:VOC family protein [Virgibacillus xinjiangensis]|uniref:VOC family protein n=1 Tax=Virgibacillus xinjiangensis TaxID=393090 RepID=A0ABV7CTP5_9BACI